MMGSMDRRNFIKNAGKAAAVMATAGPFVTTAMAKNKPSETINVAVIGIRSRGWQHAQNFAKIPNVHVKVLCDPDENLFAERVKDIEQLQGKAPETAVDIRKVLDRKDIDVIAIANQNHWHALSAIWACQAGKDVYLEKPVSHNIWESRKIVEAARKYNKVVQTGTQRRSNPFFQSAIDFIHSGKLGKVYMVRLPVFRPRESIGRGKIQPVPSGVDYDLWLGPAAWRPFIDNRFHYNWHWYWDTGNGETGNNGPHRTDLARWILQKYDLPKRIQSMGGYWGFDCDQQTPNTQFSNMEYEDGTIVQLDIRGLYTNSESNIGIGTLIYGTEGWMKLSTGKWSTYYGRKNEPGPSMTLEDAEKSRKGLLDLRGADDLPHFFNFIDAVRAQDRSILNAEILEGHLSTAMCHLCNIAYLTGRTLEFDSPSETFIGDDEANSYLKRAYRYPYVVPEVV
jgi:predicted dehydrogenase